MLLREVLCKVARGGGSNRRGKDEAFACERECEAGTGLSGEVDQGDAGKADDAAQNLSRREALVSEDKRCQKDEKNVFVASMMELVTPVACARPT